MWGINGVTGELKPILGGDNAAMKKPIAEYVKNILRGRAPWGLKVRLSGAFAQLPPGCTRLTNAEAMPRKAVKRARAGPQVEGGAAPRMGDLA